MRKWFITLILLFTLSFSGLVLSEEPTLSLDDAVAELRKDFPGKVLSTKTKKRGKKEFYEIKILVNQRDVKRFLVDPTKTYKAQRKKLSR